MGAEEMTDRLWLWCPVCSEETDHGYRILGNISTREEWRVLYCLTCETESRTRSTRSSGEKEEKKNDGRD